MFHIVVSTVFAYALAPEDARASVAPFNNMV